MSSCLYFGLWDGGAFASRYPPLQMMILFLDFTSLLYMGIGMGVNFFWELTSCFLFGTCLYTLSHSLPLQHPGEPGRGWDYLFSIFLFFFGERVCRALNLGVFVLLGCFFTVDMYFSLLRILMLWSMCPPPSVSIRYQSLLNFNLMKPLERRVIASFILTALSI